METRDLCAGDEAAVLALFERSYGRPMDPLYWRWRFLANPTSGCYGKLMWDRDRLVGHYAVSPARLLVNQASHLGALSLTTMTDPDYAGHGIFAELAQSLYHDLRRHHDFTAVWGFPNLNSHYGFVHRLGWDDLFELPMLVADARTLVDRCAGLRPADLLRVQTFDSTHSAVTRDLVAARTFSVERSPAVLNWRFCNHPEFNYEVFEWVLEGNHFFVVVRSIESSRTRGGRELNLVECWIPPDRRYLGRLLLGLAEAYAETEPGRFNLLLPFHHPLHVHAERLGFRPSEPIFQFGVRALRGSRAGLADPRRWCVWMGDSDVF
jgi:hypothetical protein